MLPSRDELPDVLLDLAVPHEDVNGLVALREVVLDDPEWRWLLGHCTAGIFRHPESVGAGGPRMPRLPRELGAMARCFAVFVFVAALPRAWALHRERGVPGEVSRRTFADLGRQIAVHRLRRGTAGVETPSWLSLHLRGELFQLGRLQFQRSRLATAWLPLAGAAPSLSLHIPDFCGPLTPAACDMSLAAAREFFPRHFPEERCTLAHCESWLLDQQLGDYLPATSNIIRFQSRFHLTDRPGGPNDSAPVRYVFGDPDLSPADLPRRTSLERAVGDHLRAGLHWYGGRGWFAL
ncbi:acyltransferase domain-containing protein [Kitasatospora atroaurantiaca]|uniref:acyltransferase domain-containing protein n=1 Tax=Kitasatospora atroaurantiaca TaxID=285545 RepID=UPI0011A35083|nr:acyltransferase domain-containing protein [Kitasatospora atroaurantiaca]